MKHDRKQGMYKNQMWYMKRGIWYMPNQLQEFSYLKQENGTWKSWHAYTIYIYDIRRSISIIEREWKCYCSVKHESEI